MDNYIIIIPRDLSFSYVTAHSPTLLSLLLRHKLFTCVTWWAAHGNDSFMFNCLRLLKEWNNWISRVYKVIDNRKFVVCENKWIAAMNLRLDHTSGNALCHPAWRRESNSVHLPIQITFVLFLELNYYTFNARNCVKIRHIQWCSRKK